MKTVLVLVNTERNFTPRDLMHMAAQQNANMRFVADAYNAKLRIDGKLYRYDHWQIGDGYVALSLVESPLSN